MYENGAIVKLIDCFVKVPRKDDCQELREFAIDMMKKHLDEKYSNGRKSDDRYEVIYNPLEPEFAIILVSRVVISARPHTDCSPCTSSGHYNQQG